MAFLRVVMTAGGGLRRANSLFFSCSAIMVICLEKASCSASVLRILRVTISCVIFKLSTYCLKKSSSVLCLFYGVLNLCNIIHAAPMIDAVSWRVGCSASVDYSLVSGEPPRSSWILCDWSDPTIRMILWSK